MHRVLHPLFALALSCLAGNALAENTDLSKRRTPYLPSYSRIWDGDMNPAGDPMKSNLSALVSIQAPD